MSFEIVDIHELKSLWEEESIILLKETTQGQQLMTETDKFPRLAELHHLHRALPVPIARPEKKLKRKRDEEDAEFDYSNTPRKVLVMELCFPIEIPVKMYQQLMELFGLLNEEMRTENPSKRKRELHDDGENEDDQECDEHAELKWEVECDNEEDLYDEEEEENEDSDDEESVSDEDEERLCDDNEEENEELSVYDDDESVESDEDEEEEDTGSEVECTLEEGEEKDSDEEDDDEHDAEDNTALLEYIHIFNKQNDDSQSELDHFFHLDNTWDFECVCDMHHHHHERLVTQLTTALPMECC